MYRQRCNVKDNLPMKTKDLLFPLYNGEADVSEGKVVMSEIIRSRRTATATATSTTTTTTSNDDLSANE